MRLINVESMGLEEFMGGGSHVPPYAILSHTWEGGEVTLQDFTNPDSKLRIQKKGFAKIEKTCTLARQDGLKYAWIDTCCIDKSSSAELTEAINSMFQWYRASVVCYAWIADLPASNPGTSQPDSWNMSSCRWFTRGWTLQELIAPTSVNFYDREWKFRGTKATLKEALAETTGIDHNALESPEVLPNFSVAKRMSWAASRQTTRIEDMAYCLLGIFDVNMPMLYGEGMRAFLRLQEEIAKESNDLSIFAWRAESSVYKYSGVFADTPAYFRDSGSIELESDTVFNPEFLLTNKGLRINTGLHSGSNEAYLLMLNCTISKHSSVQSVGIWIKPHGGGVYSRTEPSELGAATLGNVPKSHDIFLLKRISSARARELERSHNQAFMLRKGFNTLETTHAPYFPFAATALMPQGEWDSQRRMFLTRGAAEFSAFLFYHIREGSSSKSLSDGNSFLLAFGKTTHSDAPWVTIVTPYENANAFASLSDLAKTIAEVRSHGLRQQVRMRDKMGEPSGEVSVLLENAVVEGQEVYCVDLSYEAQIDLSAASLWENLSTDADVTMGYTNAVTDAFVLRRNQGGQRVRRNT